MALLAIPGHGTPEQMVGFWRRHNYKDRLVCAIGSRPALTVGLDFLARTLDRDELGGRSKSTSWHSMS